MVCIPWLRVMFMVVPKPRLPSMDEVHAILVDRSPSSLSMAWV
jgi:hypothetical protein